MFLMITVYSLAGNILFGNIKYGEAINRHANFDTTLNGIQMLFRIVTGNIIVIFFRVERPRNVPNIDAAGL